MKINDAPYSPTNQHDHPSYIDEYIHHRWLLPREMRRLVVVCYGRVFVSWSLCCALVEELADGRKPKGRKDFEADS